MKIHDNNDVLFSIAERMANELASLYKNNRIDRIDLLEFMDANQWFGIKKQDGKTPIITERNLLKFEEPLTLWLSAYKKPGRIKIDLMLRCFDDKYPKTCRIYRKFIKDNQLEDNPSAWKLLDFILSEIDREITDYDETEIEGLIKQLDTDATLTSARMFADFLRTEDFKGKPITKWVYAFDSRESPELINDAYSINDFAVMAYCTFNEEMWVSQGLIEKAVTSKVFADLWLFVALHFICALRTGDMKRLPAPALPYDGATVLKNISNVTFANQESAALVEELSIRLKLKPMKPSKTTRYDSVPNLKLFVPESLKTPLGIIMAISLAHHPEIHAGDGFVASSDNLCNIRRFFGEHFAKALGNRRFSARRCNKSYLQGIEGVVASNDSPGRPKGYMLAALARSHKSGIGNLSKTTEIYLKDACFSGYSPEFIIREMFERGVFSFIPAVLLDIYVGTEYKKLPVKSQTKLIGELGFSAHQIECMIGAVDKAFEKSRIAVNSILQNTSCADENIGEILKNIASGNAPSRQKECLCLMTAAEFPCPNPDRDACIGCGYEIYTKTALHTLMSEYARFAKLKKTAESADSWRYGKILEQAVLPAISEMLGAVKLLYGDSDISEILDIVERGIEYVDSVL